MKAPTNQSWTHSAVRVRVSYGVFLALISSLVVAGVLVRDVFKG
jgi:hypothetical protein